MWNMKNKLSWCHLWIEAIFDLWYPHVFRDVEDMVLQEEFLVSLWNRLTEKPFSKKDWEEVHQSCEEDLSLYPKKKEEVLLTSLGFYATFLYRLSHAFYQQGFVDIASILMRIGEEKTGIHLAYSARILGPICIIDGRGFYLHDQEVVQGKQCLRRRQKDEFGWIPM